MKESVIPLGKVAAFDRGLTFAKGDVTEFSNKKVLRSNNIDLDNHSLILEDIVCLREDFEIPEKKKLKKGDLFICMSNGSTQHLGKIAIINKNIDYAFGGFMGAIHPDPEKVLPRYVFYACISNEYKRFLSSIFNGININNLKWSDLSKYNIPVPPLSEQKRIVEELDLLSGIIEKQKQQLKELDTLAQSIFYDMFGDPVTNEKGWEVKQIGSICEVQTGSTPSREVESNFRGDIPWVKTTEVHYNDILDTEEKITSDSLKQTNCKLFPINTIIVAMYGQGKTRGQVAKLKIVACTNQACAAILPSYKINHNFLFYLLKYCYNDLRNIAVGCNQKNLNLKLIKNYKIILPPLSLQNLFAEKIEAIEKQKEAITKSIEETQKLFDYTMDKYFG